MNGFGMPVAIVATQNGVALRRWPVTNRRAALLWLGNQPRKHRISLHYQPAITAHEKVEDVSNRRVWDTSPHTRYGGLRLCDVI
jgi:hypothetical protein